VAEEKNQNTDGITILGNSKLGIPDVPDKKFLEAFNNKFSERDYTIHIDCPDFTSLCPVTGQPDFAHIIIDYTPGKLCVETKSLKLYLAAFRNTPSFNEEIVNRILDDLLDIINPRRMQVTGKFASRGGISLTIEANYP
jgi:7-cyano-7-deazaguanine reductase